MNSSHLDSLVGWYQHFGGNIVSILDSLKNVNNHGYLTEEIRKRVSILERFNWTIEFSWVKAHIGIYGNQLADRLAKDAT
jgi:ribonuclease HI